MGFNQRKALVRGDLNFLIENGYLNTTLIRAKYIKSHFDSIASQAKDDSLSTIRRITSVLSSSKNALRLIKTIVPLMSQNIGGYTRLSRTGIRKGDADTKARLELLATPQKATKVAKVSKKTSKEDGTNTKTK